MEWYTILVIIVALLVVIFAILCLCFSKFIGILEIEPEIEDEYGKKST